MSSSSRKRSGSTSGIHSLFIYVIKQLKLILLFLLLIFFLYLIFRMVNLLIAALLGAPIVYADSRAIIDAFKLAKLKSGQTVIDLGCGNANSLIIAAKQFGAKGIGIERSPYAYLNSKLRVWWYGESANIKIIFGDFSKIEKYLSSADIIYLYLWSSVVQKIEPWIFANIGKKTRIVSLAFPFCDHQPRSISKTMNLGSLHDIYLY